VILLSEEPSLHGKNEMKVIPSLWNSKSKLNQVLIAAAILGQIAILFLVILKPLATDMLNSRGLPVLERSAIMRFGDRFSEYTQFIRRRTGDSAILLIPYRETDEVFGNVGIMQYFLFPRMITNCPSNQTFKECFQLQAGSNTIILSVPGFPPEDLEDRMYRYVPFDEEWGIFLPLGQVMKGKVLKDNARSHR
jgi:hypothetical protein